MSLQGKAQRKISAIHILDVLVLNGSDVREQHFNQRCAWALGQGGRDDSCPQQAGPKDRRKGQLALQFAKMWALVVRL